MTDAFYTAEGGRFVASVHTRGPWSPDFQHGGPVAALIAQGVEEELGDAFHVARLTVEFLRPVPIAALERRVERTRDGRLVKSVDVELVVGGKLVARARAGGVAKRDVPALVEETDVLPEPDTCAPFGLPFELAAVGYHTAMDVRLARGTPGSGHLVAWMRARLPLFAGRALSPLERVMLAADSGNGVSACLDASRFTFLNTDVSVCLYRYPVGEWVALDARTSVGAGGVGLAHTRLHDAAGPIGQGTQPLIIEKR